MAAPASFPLPVFLAWSSRRKGASFTGTQRRSFFHSPAARHSVGRRQGAPVVKLPFSVALFETDALSVLASRHRNFVLFSPNTFVRVYVGSIACNDFSYPGEVGSPPPPVLYPYCSHILRGYTAKPAKDCAPAAPESNRATACANFRASLCDRPK